MAGTVTVNIPLAAWPPTSVAVTVVPDVPLGTRNVQLNAPLADAVSEETPVQLAPAIVTPSKTREESTVETEKPVPATVTVAPTGPWPGVTAIVGVVTVNITVLLASVVAVSVAWIGYLAEETLGTVNAQTKPPELSEVIALAVEVQSEPPVGVWATELNQTVTPDETLNPEPVTV
jgi:hypothetical protein